MKSLCDNCKKKEYCPLYNKDNEIKECDYYKIK
jgi:hypothetical protein